MKKKTNEINEITLPIAKKILPINFADLKLNLREYKFVAVYCTNGFKGPDAAQEAGYKGDRATLRGIAYDLLKRPAILEALKRFIDAAIAPYKTRLEFEILDRYYKRATYTMDIFCYEDGSTKPLDEIDPEWLQVIDGVERKYYGAQAQHCVTTYQLPNRDLALQMLYRIITGQDPNDAKNNLLPQEARTRLQRIFLEVFPGKTGAETPVKTTTRITMEQVVQRKGEPGRPRKYCKVNKGQPCVRCGQCKNKTINITPITPKKNGGG